MARDHVEQPPVMALKERNLFVIEDNLENRIILRIALTRQGASVEFERWGRDLRSHIENVKGIDAILLDLMFPNGISGYDMIDEIRQIPSLASVPIVAVSAADPCTAIPRCRAKGFAGFIAKPIDSDIFGAQIADIIAGRSVWYAG